MRREKTIFPIDFPEFKRELKAIVLEKSEQNCELVANQLVLSGFW